MMRVLVLVAVALLLFPVDAHFNSKQDIAVRAIAVQAMCRSYASVVELVQRTTDNLLASLCSFCLKTGCNW